MTETVLQPTDYRTGEVRVAPWRRAFPSLFYYLPMASIVLRASRMARLGRYGSREWGESSAAIIQALEGVGTRFRIEGTENFASLPGPCVFIGNHMSTLETFVLPALIVRHKPVTFVVKRSLIEYPVFRHVMVSRDPVVVERANPREDFKVVMEEGLRRIGDGISIVVFPQTTRTAEFDPAQFNTIGIKLAKRAGVPVVPVALKTDAWGNGRLVKDFGPIDPSRSVRFAFGPPIAVEGGGQKEHGAVIEFIQGKLGEWESEVPSP